jgi:3-oxoadipate enol-lactonase
MPLVQINDTELYYELSGSGQQTLVLLNGISMSTAAWAMQVAAFQSRFQVLRYDLRGQLQSGKPEADMYSMPQHAADLACLLDKLAIPAACLVGLSYGGAVAQQFALDYPHQVQRLLLAGTLAWSDPVNEAIAMSWEAAARTPDAALRFDIGLPLTFGAEYLVQQADNIALMRDFAARQPWLPLARLVAGMRAHDLRSRLAQINLPTLVLVGEDDRFTPLYHARLLACSIPGARLQVVANCGHAIPLERPDEFNRLVLDFFDGSA